METGTLEKKIAKLPDELKLKVEGYVDALMENEQHSISPDVKNKKGYGSMKGLIKYMADDFDTLLKEFHDYMYHISIEFIEKIEKLPLSMQQELEEIVNKMTEQSAKPIS